MSKIKIDVESLSANSSKLAAQIEELQALNARLEALITRIESSWDGQASIVYISKMRAHAEKAEKMINVLTEYKKYVDSATNKFSSVDSSAANRIRGSF